MALPPAPRAPLWELLPGLALAGLPLVRRRVRYLMALEAYIDDAGRGHRRVFCLAGFLAQAERWGSFVESWQALLDHPSETPERAALAYFKTHEAMSLTTQFAGWETAERDAFLGRAVAILTEMAPTRLAISIPVKHYKRIVAGRIAKGADTPYQLAFWSILSGFMFGIGGPALTPEPIDFIFDNQTGRDRREAEQGYILFRRMAPLAWRQYLPSRPKFEDDKQFLPLQAADLLAWHTSAAPSLYRATGRTYDTLVWSTLQALPVYEHEWTAMQLREFATGMRGTAAEKGVIYPYDLPYGHPKRNR